LLPLLDVAGALSGDSEQILLVARPTPHSPAPHSKRVLVESLLSMLQFLGDLAFEQMNDCQVL